MSKYRFIGPHNRHTETSSGIIVHGQTVGFGQEFEADEGLIEILSDRFVFEEVVGAERQDVKIDAPLVTAVATHGPHGRG